MCVCVCFWGAYFGAVRGDGAAPRVRSSTCPSAPCAPAAPSGLAGAEADDGAGPAGRGGSDLCAEDVLCSAPGAEPCRASSPSAGVVAPQGEAAASCGVEPELVMLGVASMEPAERCRSSAAGGAPAGRGGNAPEDGPEEVGAKPSAAIKGAALGFADEWLPIVWHVCQRRFCSVPAPRGVFIPPAAALGELDAGRSPGPAPDGG